MFGLDFSSEMKFNIHVGTRALQTHNFISWMTATGDPQKRSRRNKHCSLPQQCEDFRQTDCDLTQLWKA